MQRLRRQRPYGSGPVGRAVNAEISARAQARDGSQFCSDAELIRMSLTRPEHFSEIYARHSSAVFGYVARRMGQEAAEDVAAETFLTAFRVRGRYDAARDDARPWLMGIATREISYRKRAERARYRMLAKVAPEPPQEGPADRVEAVVAARALRGPLATALAGLRAVDRDVLLLVAWGDLSYQEVAEALSMPIGTVRSRLHRTRRALREQLPGLSGMSALNETDELDEANGRGRRG